MGQGSAPFASKARNRLPGQRRRFFNLDGPVFGSADADPEVGMFLQNIEPSGNGVAHPECLVTEALHFQRRAGFLLILGRASETSPTSLMQSRPCTVSRTAR